MLETSQLAVAGLMEPDFDRVLTPPALSFLSDLVEHFASARKSVLAERVARQKQITGGATPNFLRETAYLRTAEWRVNEVPPDLQDRRVEITGPASPKMMINALNSGARVFMADLEDALSPTWLNVMQAQLALQDAVRGTLAFDGPGGQRYRVAEQPATLVVRPRGWHLIEKHVTVRGEPIPASLFDFGLYFFHNAQALMQRGSGPYFYLPKLEGHREARLWNEIFCYAQDALGVPRGTIKATVLIETVLAAFEMDEILYELREHCAGLNAGRWDYIFSLCKKFRHDPAFTLPDRAQVTMTTPFMRAYTDLLVQTCHRRGAHAIGGMAAFVPSRQHEAVTRVALAKVREDKEREAGDGFDGTWVAHPDLVPVAMAVFDKVLKDASHQRHRLRPEVRVTAARLLDVSVAGGEVTESGVRMNIDVTLQYLAAWLEGQGAVAIHHLMEDAATAEIGRAQLWQWLRHAVTLADGRRFDQAMYFRWRQEALTRLGGTTPERFQEASRLLDGLVLADEFVDFLTLPAYIALEG